VMAGVLDGLPGLRPDGGRRLCRAPAVRWGFVQTDILAVLPRGESCLTWQDARLGVRGRATWI
jgi:hypothetical protein